MKKFKNLTLVLTFLTVLLIGTTAFSSNNSDLKEFRIEFQSTKNGLKLIGRKGTAFKELKFTLRNNLQKSIDEYGMRNPKSENNTHDEKLADFEFTIEKARKEYVLVGKKGTTWARLTFAFSKNNKAIVDENGVTVE